MDVDKGDWVTVTKNGQVQDRIVTGVETDDDGIATITFGIHLHRCRSPRR